MKTEFEIKFSKINKDEIREKIKSLWWICTKKNTLMKRVVFDNPVKNKSYVRVRDEWDKITCTYKEIIENKDWNLDINSVKELETKIQDFDTMVWIFRNLWLSEKAYQESYREIWAINNEIEFMIDEWPWISPFIEIEWESEDLVKKYSDLLWFNYEEWIFWAVDEIYFKELWIERDVTNNIKIITFENPLKKWSK